MTIRLKLPSATDPILTLLQNSGYATVLSELQDKAEAYLFAGAVRDAVAWHEFGWGSPKPRDLDIGICGVTRDYFNGFLTEWKAQRNRYGGYRLELLGAPPADIWRLEDSIGLTVTNTRFSIENVLRSFVLSCNAIGLDLAKSVLHDAGAMSSLHRRQICLVENAIIHSKATFAAKALLLHHRYPLRLSPELKVFVAENLEFASLLHEVTKSILNHPDCPGLGG